MNIRKEALDEIKLKVIDVITDSIKNDNVMDSNELLDEILLAVSDLFHDYYYEGDSTMLDLFEEEDVF